MIEMLSSHLKTEEHKRYKLSSCQKVWESLSFLLDSIYIRFGTKLYRQIVSIPIRTNCAPLVAYLFCFAMKDISSDRKLKLSRIMSKPTK